MAKKKDEVQCTKTFDSRQTVSTDGKSIRMADGSTFKRVVLRSPMEMRAMKAEEEQMLDELAEES